MRFGIELGYLIGNVFERGRPLWVNLRASSLAEAGCAPKTALRGKHRSKGFGFVEMPNEDEANAAIAALNGAELDGRPLRVNESQPKPREDRPRRPYGGGGYGDRPRRPYGGDRPYGDRPRGGRGPRGGYGDRGPRRGGYGRRDYDDPPESQW